MKHHAQSTPDWKLVAAARLKKIRLLMAEREWLRDDLQRKIYSGLLTQFHAHCIGHPKGREAGEKIFQDMAQFISEQIIPDHL